MSHWGQIHFERTKCHDDKTSEREREERTFSIKKKEKRDDVHIFLGEITTESMCTVALSFLSLSLSLSHTHTHTLSISVTSVALGA